MLDREDAFHGRSPKPGPRHGGFVEDRDVLEKSTTLSVKEVDASSDGSLEHERRLSISVKECDIFERPEVVHVGSKVFEEV